MKFDPAAFSWAEQASRTFALSTVSKLVHRSTSYYFVFDRGRTNDHKFNGKFCPGTNVSVVSYASAAFPLQLLKTWMKNVKRESEALNFWETLSHETALLEAAEETNNKNRPFSKEEREKLAVALEEIKKYLLINTNLAAANQTRVQRQFDYLHDAAERLGRKDWLIILIGTMFGLAGTIALTPDCTRDWFRFAGLIIRQLLGTFISFPSVH